MASAQEETERARQLLARGRLAEAEAICRDLLGGPEAPDEVLELLGALCAAEGDHGSGAVESWFVLALANGKRGRLDRAAAGYREVLRRDPDRADAHANLGVVLAREGRREESLAHLRRAAALRPEVPEIHANLGNALEIGGQLDEAAAAFERAIRVRPSDAGNWLRLVNLLSRAGRFCEAIARGQQATALLPGDASLHCALAFALAGAGQLATAESSYRTAIGLAPELAGAYCGLGHVLTLAHRYLSAIDVLHKAIALQPDYADALGDLGIVNGNIGRIDDAVSACRKALALRPSAKIHSNLLFLLHNSLDVSPKELFQEHRAWNAVHGADSTAPALHRPRRGSGKIRVGYVSPDFRDHSISYFLKPILAGHDRSRFHVVCYSDVLTGDAMTGEYRALADEWHDTATLPDVALRQRIADSGLDLLMDLAVHTGGNRLSVFARKPAPVQISYLGYPGTTGLSTMDYRLTDAVLDPPGASEAFNSEKLLRLENGYFCYQPADAAVVHRRKPAPDAGGITFVVFQALTKVNARMASLWAQILKAVPGSTLWMKARGLREEALGAEFRRSFAALGIGAERLRLEGWGSFDQYLAALSRADIALDTFPFNGGTTTCHSLWMGVPVVSLEGQLAVSRMGSSILRRVGLQDLVATTHEQYVRAAVELAEDRSRLAGIQAELRGRMIASSLLDRAGFMADYEAALERAANGF